MNAYISFYFIAKTWKQLRHPLINEWINTLVQTYSGLLFRNKNK